MTQITVGLTVIALYILGIIGWILNIFHVFGADFTRVTGGLILQIIGIFLPPLGAVLGWIL